MSETIPNPSKVKAEIEESLGAKAEDFVLYLISAYKAEGPLLSDHGYILHGKFEKLDDRVKLLAIRKAKESGWVLRRMTDSASGHQRMGLWPEEDYVEGMEEDLRKKEEPKVPLLQRFIYRVLYEDFKHGL